MTAIQHVETIEKTSAPVRRISIPAAYVVAAITALVFAGFVLLRLPFRAIYPVNWDAVQLALGTQAFDLHHHQPHPPGYIGFIGLGWLINQVTGNPILSLTILSIAGGAIAPALLYLHGRTFLENRFALVTALLFGVSPLIWYYSEVALTYSIEVAAGIGFMLLAHRSLRTQAFSDLLLATLLLSLVGSLRQSAMLFLIPVWLYCVWAHPWRERFTAAGVMGAVSLTWAVPLIWLSGGVSAYLRESRALADLIGGQTSVLSMNFDGLQMNGLYVLAGIGIGLNAGLLIIGLALALGVRPLRRLTRQDRIFYLLWLGPALVTFLLGHTGQLGYVLLLLPPLFLLTGICLEELATMGRHRLATGAVMVFAALSTTGFLVLPGVAYARVQPEPGAMETRTSLHMRQYDLATSDTHWASFEYLVRHYRPENTVILTTVGGPRVSGSFRHASYLLPEYRVYGLGNDPDGVFGYLFMAQHMRSDYSVEALYDVRPWLAIDADARWVIIPDQEILAWIDPAIERRVVTLDSGSTVVVAFIPPATSIEFNRREW